MAKDTRRAEFEQLREKLRARVEAIREQLGHAPESPQFQALQEQVRLADSPRGLRAQQELQGLIRWLEQQQHPAPPAPKPQPKLAGKKAAGAKRKLTDKQISELQQALRCPIERDPSLTRKHDNAIAWLRQHPARKIQVGKSTLYRYVTLPVLGPRGSKRK
jgi:hypothetical protein